MKPHFTARVVAFGCPWIKDRLKNINEWWKFDFEWDYYDSPSPIECQKWGDYVAMDETMVRRWKDPLKDFTLLVAPVQKPAKDYSGKEIAVISNAGIFVPWHNTIQVFANEHDKTSDEGVELGDTFTVFANHELSHFFYLNIIKRVDKTHLYFYDGRPELARAEIKTFLS